MKIEKKKEIKEENDGIEGKLSWNILNIENNLTSKQDGYNSKSDKLNNQLKLNLISVRSNSLTNNFNFINSKTFFISLIFILILFIFSITIVSAQVNNQKFGVAGGDRFGAGASNTGSFTGSGSGSYFYSNPQHLAPGFGAYTSAERGYYWPQLYGGNASSAREMCRQRQDFIIQVAPGGCSPAVVRSDLLAEQNVPVFCKLQAIQINPAIRAEDIRQITFSYSGKLPEGVLSVVPYNKPRYALSPYKSQFGFATIDNVGYAVIILKQQPDERNLSDFVAGNLTANIYYNAEYGFGLGINEKTIPVLSDIEWAANYPQYTFAGGKAFLRVDEIQGDQARVSVYSDATHKIDSFTVSKKIPAERYFPGGYCSLGYKVSYVGSFKQEKQVTIQFDQDTYDVYKGESFADGICEVTSIATSGAGAGTANIRCKTTEGLRTIPLTIGFKNIKLDFSGANPQGYSAGELLYTGGNADVYLGAVGNNNGNVPFVVLVALDKDELFTDLIQKEINKVNLLSNVKNIKVGDKIYDIEIIRQGEEIGDYQGKNVKFSDFVSTTQEATGDSAFENYFDNAIEGYESVENDYGEIKFYNNEKTYGYNSLVNVIELARDKGKAKTLADLIARFKEKYPNEDLSGIVSNDGLTNFNTDDAGYVFDLYWQRHTVILRSVQDPNSVNDGGAKILVDGSPKTLQEGEYIVVPGVDEDNKKTSSVQLSRFDDDKITVVGRCVNDGGGANSETAEIFVGGRKPVCGYDIFVQQVIINKAARIRLDPIVNNLGSQTNISYAIGIEKRAIKLNPEKTRERISKLNESIAKWQNISESLGSVVKGMKAACFATNAALQVKNLFSGLGGKALARQQVMRGDGGWKDICSQEMNDNPGKYVSLENCYMDHSKEIERDVSAVASKMERINNRIKNMEASTPGLIEKSGTFGGSSVNYQKSADVNVAYLSGKKDLAPVELSDKDGKNKINPQEIIRKLSKDSVSYSEMRDIELNLEIINDNTLSDDMKEAAEKRLYSTLNKVNEIQVDIDIAKRLGANAEDTGIAGKTNVLLPETHFGTQRATDYYTGSVVDRTNNNFQGLDQGAEITAVILDSKTYYVPLKQVPGTRDIYTIDFDKGVYTENGKSKLNNESETDKSIINKVRTTYGNRVLQKVDAQYYNNLYKDPEVKYYETEPYKGMPAVVPIDLNNGWYAATKQTLPAFGEIKAFQDSGRVSSFWLCNVGKNGRMEFDSGLGDDICQQFNIFTGQPATDFYGLSDRETAKKVSDSIQALEQASSQYKQGIRYVNILGRRIKVGNPATNLPQTECSDFMSPSDCKILFNVCDPVICPASRCNLGGKFYVDDVVQSGIAGSLFLCLPNYKQGIVVPVCLTGVHAGIDNYVSILKASRDCLQESITTGRYVGICDEITAVYQCEFFWRQVSPILNVLLPKLLEFATGQNSVKGGGEYLSVQSAWSNMQSSINYFTNVYGVNAMNSYKMRSTQEVGTQICKSFVSTKYPKKFQNLIEPDSPSQFSAWFDEIKQSDATIPATSQYKVYYHIFAGNDAGVYYSIYLRDSPGEALFQSTGSVVVDTGFVARGEYADQARDFTAPSGFRELCVRVNGQEKCGFKQVSTSFGLNYLRDQYIKNQITNTQITNEKACISGTPGALALVNPNIQSGVEDVINPEIYSRGVIRVCATNNPGGTTDAGRWVNVGYCDDQKIGCWLDKNSVDVAFTEGNIGVRNATIKQLNEYAEQLDEIEKGKRVSVNGDIENELKRIEERIANLFVFSTDIDSPDSEAKILLARLDALNDKYVLAIDQSARILFDRAKIYHAMADIAWKEFRSRKAKVVIKTEEGITPGGEGDGRINFGFVSYDKRESRESVIREILKQEGIKINLENGDYSNNGNDCKGTCVGGLTGETLWAILSVQNVVKNIEITGGSENLDRNEDPVHTSQHHNGEKFDLASNEASKKFYSDWRDATKSSSSSGALAVILSLFNNIRLSPQEDFVKTYNFPANSVEITPEFKEEVLNHYDIAVDQGKVYNYIKQILGEQSSFQAGDIIPASNVEIDNNNLIGEPSIFEIKITDRITDRKYTQSDVLNALSKSSKSNARCKEYAGLIYTYSSQNNVDPLLVSAVMIKESSCVFNADSGSTSQISFCQGASYGLMQISGKTWCGNYNLLANEKDCKEDKDYSNDKCINDLKNNAGKNVEVGIKILKQYYSDKQMTYTCKAFISKNQNEPAISHDYTGWSYAVRSYNGKACAGYRKDGSEIFADQDYVVKVNEIFADLKKSIGIIDDSSTQNIDVSGYTDEELAQIT